MSGVMIFPVEAALEPPDISIHHHARSVPDRPCLLPGPDQDGNRVSTLLSNRANVTMGNI